MSLIKDSEKPHNSTVQEWMELIRDGAVGKPRWQRGVVWDDRKIQQLLEALLHKRPVGALLTLPCSSDPMNQIFRPERLQNAPEPENCELLILDGQQRLTALWNAFENSFADEDYSGPAREFFVHVEVREEDNSLIPKSVYCIKPNKTRVDSEKLGDLRGKDAIEDPVACWNARLIPVRLLARHKAPATDDRDELEIWCDEVFQEAIPNKRLWKQIGRLAEELGGRDISHYRLASNTSREDAINAFVRTNESSATISRFDIAVAEIDLEVLASEEEGLRSMIQAVFDELPWIDRYFGTEENARVSRFGELVLKVACLLCGQMPTDRSYTESEVIRKVAEKWTQIVDGIEESLLLLEHEKIFDDRRLPSHVPLRVLPALHVHATKIYDTDKKGQVHKLMVSYLWRSFLTERYDRQANQRLFDDFKKLADDIECIKRNQSPLNQAPIFDEQAWPVPSHSQLKDLKLYNKKPNSKNKLSRAVFACTLWDSCFDFASDEKLNPRNITDLQYHHLFPEALMKSSPELRDGMNHPLNFVLISAITNRKLAAKTPLKYLEERVDKGKIDTNDIKRRVKSHSVPYDKLQVDKVNLSAYKAFISARASMVREHIETRVS